jgi:hypothetical protein
MLKDSRNSAHKDKEWFHESHHPDCTLFVCQS